MIRERTARTVLTTEWCDGQDFYRLVDDPDAGRRSHVGRVIARFAYRSLFTLGALNADPHPGNYLFPKTEAVVFLDFGCVRRFEPSFLDPQRALLEVVLEGRRGDFDAALLATGMVARPERFDFDLHWQVLRHQYAPYLAARFTFTTDYIREGIRFVGPDNRNNRRISIPPPWIWTQRLVWGLHAVLARLGAEGDFRSILREALDARPATAP